METFDKIFEIGTSILLLVLGIWATAFSYGLVGDRLAGGFRWNAGFKRQLRWFGPLLVVSCVASFFFTLR